jgi:hypothetical protein
VKKLVISGICACGFVLLAASHGATASSLNRHSITIPKQSLLVVLAGFGCTLVNGQLVCGKSGKNKSSDSDNDDEADEHENSKKHKKHKNEDMSSDDGLTECSIQDSSGGSGCVVGFKHVCEKLKNGKNAAGACRTRTLKPQPQPAGSVWAWTVAPAEKGNTAPPKCVGADCGQ